MKRPLPRRPPPAGRLAVLLLAAAVAAAGLACGSRNGAEKEPAFRRVTPPVAFEMIRDYPGLPILDVRPRSEFHGPLGHLRGAMPVPRSELPSLLRDIAWLRKETFLVYCHATECEPEVLDFLHAHGFEDAMMMHGGIESWRELGFGTVGAGDPPEHEDRARSLSEPPPAEEDDDSDIL